MSRQKKSDLFLSAHNKIFNLLIHVPAGVVDYFAPVYVQGRCKDKKQGKKKARSDVEQAREKVRQGYSKTKKNFQKVSLTHTRTHRRY